jgi:hypothetical protein
MVGPESRRPRRLSMPSSELLKHSLDEAFRLHMQKLFEVLLVEPTDASLQRFFKGLGNASTMYDRIEGMLDNLGVD